ncbi:GNAT family N-acetyltransferase [Caldibacillus lycopersici]|uniref:GNAT family N-acetyltransferase n=1 Tax=Perspicuibacillus lycopersici TaxID=1325689 RepID=A0AAE3IUE0_9BACI|nr:GNAT family protein [Perspicuibacillus lycopersici]MCU9614810.1 GNAT family N-acetyltransferase [Perspicuibacillus lycopersici]
MTEDQIYANIPILETERLILRKLKEEDLQDMHAYGSDEQVSKYVSWDTHQSLEDTKRFLYSILEQYDKKQNVFWAIEWKENNRLIGTINFVSWSPKHKKAEIGYVLSRDYWGRGIMTEAMNTVIKFGFEHMDLVRLEARAMAENIGSYRVMEKVGMTYEGTIRKGMLTKGHHRDLRLYSILKEEYLTHG